ncbi:MAG: hypothetical protein DRR19_11955 [Candidatus Parabeggiatoa sp. nov. 1]|nr:MAG: hypothetical protein DRR19_11955 [Gammaproteobacteria bacterium]
MVNKVLIYINFEAHSRKILQCVVLPVYVYSINQLLKKYWHNHPDFQMIWGRLDKSMGPEK